MSLHPTSKPARATLDNGLASKAPRTPLVEVVDPSNFDFRFGAQLSQPVMRVFATNERGKELLVLQCYWQKEFVESFGQVVGAFRTFFLEKVGSRIPTRAHTPAQLLTTRSEAAAQITDELLVGRTQREREGILEVCKEILLVLGAGDPTPEMIKELTSLQMEERDQFTPKQDENNSIVAQGVNLARILHRLNTQRITDSIIKLPVSTPVVLTLNLMTANPAHNPILAIILSDEARMDVIVRQEDLKAAKIKTLDVEFARYLLKSGYVRSEQKLRREEPKQPSTVTGTRSSPGSKTPA